VPYFDFNHPDWEDSGGPTPLLWRFGEYRRWHRTLDFLYEIRKDGQLMWGPALRFTAEEAATIHPVHQNLPHPQNHTVAHARKQDRR
jgi:hypothetical protein